MADKPFNRDDDVKVLNIEHSFAGFFNLKTYVLQHRQFAGGWGKEIRRELFVRGEAAGVLLYDPNMDAIALVEQFRLGALPRSEQPWLLELVAGIIEPGEAPDALVRRESVEEAGCEVQKLEFVAEYFNSPSGSDEYFYLFCGSADLSNVGGIHGVADEGEDIRVHVLAFEKALTMLAAGQLNNAQTIIALQWLQLNRQRLLNEWS